MRLNRLIALMAFYTTSLSAATPAVVAIKCTGITEALPAGTNAPDSMIFIIDEKTEMVSLWDTKSQARMPICISSSNCVKKFGGAHIRIVQQDSGGSHIVDVERDTGEVMYIKRSRSPNGMVSFEGTCSKTAIPASSGPRKF